MTTYITLKDQPVAQGIASSHAEADSKLSADEAGDSPAGVRARAP